MAEKLMTRRMLDEDKNFSILKNADHDPFE